MSIDYRDVFQPVLTTIYLGNGLWGVSASPSPPPQSNSPPQDSTTSNVPSSTSKPVLSFDPGQRLRPDKPTFSTISTTKASPPTSTYSSPAEISTTGIILPSNTANVTSSDGPINSQALRGLSLVAIITLPILVLMIISSIVLLCCRARQRRKTRCRRGEQGRPQQKSVFASLKGSFTEQNKTAIVQHSAYFPAVTVSRDPSPTPEARGRPDLQSLSSHPRDTVGTDPPPPYVLQSDSLRPPSMYGRIHTRSPSPTLSEANLSVHDDATLRSPFGSPYLDVDSDALSDISFDPGYSLRRQRDTDEVSFVSALEPDEHVERDLHYIV